MSRARAHQRRETVRMVPIKHGMSVSKIIKSKPKVAPCDPVAWEYIAARGNDPFELVTAERSVIPYNMAMA